MSRTAPGSPARPRTSLARPRTSLAWPRTVLALCLADTRRRLNLLVGAGPSARHRRRAARLVVAGGAAAVLGALVVVGRTLGALAPPGPDVRTELAAWTWAPVVAWFLHQVLTAEPAKARALVSPPDASVLRTLPVSRAQLVTARLVVPAAGIAVLVLVAATAIGAPWLAGGAEGRRLLPVFLLHCAGAAVTGVALHIALVTALMVRVVRIPTCRACSAPHWSAAPSAPWPRPSYAPSRTAPARPGPTWPGSSATRSPPPVPSCGRPPTARRTHCGRPPRTPASRSS
ncbi:hypothetical protein AB6O49_17955 [Streptomyces sp. SBR177]